MFANSFNIEILVDILLIPVHKCTAISNGSVLYSELIVRFVIDGCLVTSSYLDSYAVWHHSSDQTVSESQMRAAKVNAIEG